MKLPLPPVLFLVGLAAIAALWALHSERYGLGWPVALIGLIPFFLGLGLAIRAKGLFRKIGTNVVSDLPPDRLVTHGPFRYSRNPMYLGMTAALFGAAAISGALCAFLVPLAFAALVTRSYIRSEERMMAEAFGPDWDAYRAKVRRWF